MPCEYKYLLGVGTMEERKKNPMKQLAMYLAHQMDDEKRIYDENLHPRKEEEIREAGKELRDEIYKSGYNIGTLLHYADEYKNLNWADYHDWAYI